MLAYLDNAATTPLRAAVLDAMMPYLTHEFGNPSGIHSVSRFARAALEDARKTVAQCVGAEPGEIIFTSGGTESDNLALQGVTSHGGGTVVCSAIEHHAVLNTVEALGGSTFGVDESGIVDFDQLIKTLDTSVSAVSVMSVNNEIGVIQPLDEIAQLVRRHAPNAVFHTDAAQAFSWLDVARITQLADMVSLSAHKFGGPKGVGALVVRSGTDVAPIHHGGGQERERRSGTQNVAGIVGMATAMAQTAASREFSVARIRKLRDKLADTLLSSIPGTLETGNREDKIVANCHLRFQGVESEELLVMLDEKGVCASAGSACSSGAMLPSHVLVAMGIPAHDALSSVRLTLGPTTSDDDVDMALKVLPDIIAQLRGDLS